METLSPQGRGPYLHQPLAPASQWENIVNTSLLSLEKQSVRRLDGLIGTIQNLIASAGHEAPHIREDIRHLEDLRRRLTGSAT
jgi:hypothetical protein